MRMLLAVAVVLAAVAQEASARVDVCKRQCAVVFTRGGSNCQHKVKAGIKARKSQCKTDFKSSGFANVGKCKSAAQKVGNSLIATVCKGSAKDACLMCCANGGTVQSCAPRSPSGAFLDLAGPLF